MKSKSNFYKHHLKRVQDFMLALIALVLLSPVLLIIGLLVFMFIGRPVLFTQVRPGLHEKPFKMVKFRTMSNTRDQQGHLLSDDQRLTRFGKILRSTSLDELPELYNILKGDMSFIGPRPLLMEYLPLYNEIQRTRHSVRPGLSGLAQISGRNAISWSDKFTKDIEYIENMSWSYDWKLIFLTLKKVIKKEGISSDASVTMEPFKGNENINVKG